MPRLIYIETTIPSFYFETRMEPEILARHNWTVEWWDAPDLWAERVTSRVVIEELERTPEPKRQRCLDFVSSLKLLPYTSEVDEIVQTYRQHKVMPMEASGDADHLALATFHGCDMVVTWNCQHIANANKFPHIRRINALLGYATPQLVTPLALLPNAL